MLQIIREPLPVSPTGARRVLLVERDAESARTIGGSLALAGFDVTTLAAGEDALRAIERDKPHLILLDWEHPGVAVSSLIDHLRRELPARRARVIALSLLSAEHQIVAGFEMGLDDYVTRPYSLPVLVARVNAVLRPLRSTDSESEVLRFQRLRIDCVDQRVMVEEHIVPLRPMEFRLLVFFVRNPERVFTRDQLLARVWGRDSHADERAVDVTIQRTRRALARHGCGEHLQTVRGFGYRLSRTGI